MAVTLGKADKSGKGRRKRYTKKEIDAIAVYLPCIDKVVWLPPELWEGKSAVWLRTSPPLNGQKVKIKFVNDYLW